MGALVAPILLAALAAAPHALAAASRELPIAVSGSPLPLPTVLPPAGPVRPMVWAKQAAGRPTASEFAAGKAVVGLAAPAAGISVLRRPGLRALAAEPELQAVEVAGAPATLVALARAAAGDRGIRYVEAPVRRGLLHRRDDPWLNTLDQTIGLPWEWPFAHVGVDRALNLTKGSPSVLVGVIDSGISPIPDLAGKVVQTFHFDSQSPDALDAYGHGTFVSSIIAANNDDGIGLAGFCGACRLLVFKVDPIDSYTEATAIRRLVDEHVRILSLSFGSPAPSSLEADAIAYATAHGVLVVAATGNDGSDQVVYPAALLQQPQGGPSSGLAVGASEASDAPASFSNFGDRLSLLAPGAFSGDCRLGIFGALPLTPTVVEQHTCAPPVIDPSTGARYVYAEGTSFAAPEVAGVAALVAAAAPTLSNSDIASVLTTTAKRPAGTGWTATSGWGVVDAAKALEYTTGKVSADRVVVGRVVPQAKPAAGQLMQVAASVHWSDGVAIPAGAVTCDVQGAGRMTRVRGQLAEGIAVCQWRVWQTAAGRRLTGIIGVNDGTGVKGTGSFALTVPAPKRKHS